MCICFIKNEMWDAVCTGKVEKNIIKVTTDWEHIFNLPYLNATETQL